MKQEKLCSIAKHFAFSGKSIVVSLRKVAFSQNICILVQKYYIPPRK